MPNTTMSQARNQANHLREQVGTTAAQALHQSQEAADAMARAIRQGYISTERTIRKHPYETVAICAGVLLAAGLIVGLCSMSGSNDHRTRILR